MTSPKCVQENEKSFTRAQLLNLSGKRPCIISYGVHWNGEGRKGGIDLQCFQRSGTVLFLLDS